MVGCCSPPPLAEDIIKVVVSTAPMPERVIYAAGPSDTPSLGDSLFVLV